MMFDELEGSSAGRLTAPETVRVVASSYHLEGLKKAAVFKETWKPDKVQHTFPRS